MNRRRTHPWSRSHPHGYVAFALVFVVGMAGTTLPTPLYPLYQQQLGFSQLMVAVIFATYAFAVLAALIATGPWSDQIGRRPVLAGALATGMISSLLFLVGQSLGWLLLARVFSGLSAGLFTATATVMIIELAPAGHKARAAVVAACANMGGLGLGPLLAGVISQYLLAPLHLVYGIDLVLLLVCCFIVWRCPEPVDRPAHPRLKRQRLGLPTTVRPVFGPAAIACVAAFALLALLTSLEPAIVGEVTGVTNRATIGALVFMVFVASLAGQVLQGRLTEGARLPLSCIALVAGAGLLAVSMAVGSMAILLCGAVVAGLGQGGIFAASISAVTEASPDDRKAEVTALLFVVIYLSVALPVLGLGVAIELSGLRTAGIAFALLVLLLSMAALFALWRHRKCAPARPCSCQSHIPTRSS